MRPADYAIISFKKRSELRDSVHKIVEYVKDRHPLFPLPVERTFMGVRMHRLNIGGVPLRVCSAYDVIRGEILYRLDVGYSNPSESTI